MAFNPNEPRDYHGRWTDYGGNKVPDYITEKAKSNIQSEQQASDLDELMNKAKESVTELQQVADSISEKFNANVVPVNLKSRGRILEKANNEYGGNVFEIKDSLRTTIIVPDDKVEAVVKELSSLPGTVRVKTQHAETDILGYSGNITNYKFKNGIIGEIQVNSPNMIIAKERVKDSINMLGEAEFNRVKSKYKSEPGQGHVIYEQYRSLTMNDERTKEQRQELEKKSKEYYNRFRENIYLKSKL